MANLQKKILIIDDDENFVWIVEQNFTSKGFSVVTAGNGEEGLKMAEKEKPDLILLDLLMPKMDGMEMAKQMKAKGINIPIIFLTNMSDVDHISKAIEAGPSDYIIKSDVSVDKIVAEVKKKLGLE